MTPQPARSDLAASPVPKRPLGLVSRLVRRVHKAPGSAPGTLQHTGERKVERVRIRLIDYDAERIEERELERIDDAFAFAEQPPVTWVNVDGLHDVSLAEAVTERFGIHRLAMEDVLSPTQRPKVEDYEDHFLVILKMLSFDATSDSIAAEQVSLVAGPGYLFSFQEREGDVFEPVRERLRQGRQRIRSRGTDYLAYTLIDAIVDNYFRILEEVGDRIEELEQAVMDEPSIELMHRIHHLRGEVLVLRRAVWPLRETLGQMYRGEIPRIAEETQLFLRDVYDHCVQVIDTAETLREVLSGAMDLYMSGVSNRMNEVMKVLTIIATIFIPLSFFAGLYGMNFQYMPELGLRWAYPVLLGAMALLAGGMLWVFRRRGWL
ncbi:MAG TPA: magnesium/cobalt transporter CorA [Longimicrobiales bacterium]|nr:magnesium/cobalt transporter CorA [Longimicrobiales bacterium]